jgi:hypothetical protein
LDSKKGMKKLAISFNLPAIPNHRSFHDNILVIGDHDGTPATSPLAERGNGGYEKDKSVPRGPANR